MKKILILILTFFMFLPAMSAEYPRWVSLPISVYIPENGNYTRLMKNAFEDWERVSDNLVRFSYTRSSESADITVEFVDFVVNCGDGHAVGCARNATRGRNYTKSLISIATKDTMVKYTQGQFKRTTGSRPINNIYGVMLHEIGHALGLGHSEDSNSVMYPYDLKTMQYLTENDLQLLYNKYH